MKTRRLGRTDLQVSEISLGTEYLIDVSRQTVVEVIAQAVDAGVNYFDTMFAPAHYRDNLGAALDGKRQGVLITGHLGAAETDGQYRRTRDIAECSELLEDLLRRLKTDYVDVLLLSNCDEQDDYDSKLMSPGGLLDLARQTQAAGKARFIGFSGHKVGPSRLAVESGAVDVLMHSINISVHSSQGKQELYRACAANDVGLIAMKAFSGGALLAEGARAEIDPVRCISYVLGQPGVTTALPGVKNIEELTATLAYVSADDAQRDYSDVLGQFAAPPTGECCYCNHCQPCPAGIDIGRTLRMSVAAENGVTEALTGEFETLPADPRICIECGACTSRCPFGVDVIAELKTAAARFEK